MKYIRLLTLLYTGMSVYGAAVDPDTKIDTSNPRIYPWTGTTLKYDAQRFERTYDEAKNCTATTTTRLIERPSMIILNHSMHNNLENSVQSLVRAGVSAHYMIGHNGTIYQLVLDEYRAFHAGHARWKVKPGATTGQDVNSMSLGVILSNAGPEATPRTEYTQDQMNALKALLTYKMEQYKILPSNIIGHGECAIDPTTLRVNRKQGPGHHFPWEQLNEAGICYGHGLDESTLDTPNEMGEVKLHACLETIGYFVPRETADPEELKTATACVIEQFNRRYDRENFENLCKLGTQGAITDRVKNMAQAVAAKVQKEEERLELKNLIEADSGSTPTN